MPANTAKTVPAMSTLCRWPTMKYVSSACQSNGTADCMTPVMPPMVNKAMRPQAKSSGVLKRSDPPHIVASQLKILTPVGMAMSMLVPAMITLNSVGNPVANMWCCLLYTSDAADDLLCVDLGGRRIIKKKKKKNNKDREKHRK